MLLELLAKEKALGDRVLLFSQFTMVLDILEEVLRMSGHSFTRIDGSTPVTERQQRIDEYSNDESIFVFLLSTKAGTSMEITAFVLFIIIKYICKRISMQVGLVSI